MMEWKRGGVRNGRKVCDTLGTIDEMAMAMALMRLEMVVSLVGFPVKSAEEGLRKHRVGG